MNHLFYSVSAPLEAATRHWQLMLWNTWLALIPLALAWCLFRKNRQRTALWWLGLAVFIAFLPNAPYVLTDIIHLVRDMHRGYSIWVITLIVVPQFLLFMLIGFEAYVLSVLALGQYLRRQSVRFIPAIELGIHGLSAVGIYLGRFRRFNSWDILTQPDALLSTTINHLANERPLIIMVITFCVITGLYWVGKQLTLALVWYWPRRHRLNRQC